MSKWEITVKQADARTVPPSLRDLKNDYYEATSSDCAAAQAILDAGRQPQAEVTDTHPETGVVVRPPLVLKVWDPFR